MRKVNCQRCGRKGELHEVMTGAGRRRMCVACRQIPILFGKAKRLYLPKWWNPRDFDLLATRDPAVVRLLSPQHVVDAPGWDTKWWAKAEEKAANATK